MPWRSLLSVGWDMPVGPSLSLPLPTPDPAASPDARWQCQARHQMHCCGLIEVAALKSHGPLLSVPGQDLDVLQFKMSCKLTHSPAPGILLNLQSHFQILASPSLSTVAQDPVSILTSSFPTIHHRCWTLLWALPDVPLNSGCCVLLRFWCFLLGCPNIRFWLNFTLLFFHGQSGFFPSFTLALNLLSRKWHC